MDKIKPQSILAASLLGVLFLFSLSLLSDKRSLQRENHAFLEESHRLENLLGKTKQHRRKLVERLQSNAKKTRSLTEALKKTQADAASVKEEKTYLEEMLLDKTKEIETLKTQNQGQAAAQEPALSAGNNPEELKRLSEQNNLLKEKLNRLYKIITGKISEINIAKITLGDTVASAKKNIEDEWNTVNLGSVTAGSAQTTAQTAAAKLPKSEGHVLAINNEHGFVVIDLGRADNLGSDAILEVKKNGQAIATLSVLEIRDAMAACNIKDIRDGQHIEINDPVSTLR